MFDSIADLPLHPLVVHAVIVLLPLSALGAVLVAIKADWNRRFGFLVVASSFVAAGSVRRREGERREARLAHRLSRPTTPSGASGSWSRAACCSCPSSRSGGSTARTPRAVRPLAKALAVVQILVAVVALVFAVLAGHSGAQAVWGRTIPNTQVGKFPTG